MQGLLELPTDPGGVAGQVFCGNHLKRRQSRSRRKVAAAEGRCVQRKGVDAAIGTVPQRRAGQRRADGHRTARQRFGQHQDIWHHRLPLTGEQLACAAQARLDLIDNQQAVVGVAKCANLLQVALRRHDHPALALDRFENKGADIPLAQGTFQRRQIAKSDRIAARQQRLERVAVLVSPGDRQRSQGLAVIAVVAIQDSRSLHGRHRQLQRRLYRLGARVAEKHPLQVSRRQLTQALGQQAGLQGHRYVLDERGVLLLQIGL